MQNLYRVCDRIDVMISRFLKISLFNFIRLLVVCGIFFTTTSVSAQLNESSDISIGLLPANPQPNQSIQITIESYSINLDASKITWYVNGKEVRKGTGVKNIYTQTGKLGTETSVKVTVDTGTGIFTKNISIMPASVSIIWEARTYTPPFFKGKALFSHQSNIVFVAAPRIIANGKEIPKENLIYTWSKNGTTLGDQNGYGRYMLPITGSIISRPLSIDLEVSDPDTGITAFNTIDIAPIEPEIINYIVDPLYGVQYNKALSGSLPLKGREVTLIAVPYFFSSQRAVNGGELTYTWSINGDTISDNLNTNTRVFRKVGDVFGISNISLKVEQINRLLQFASSDVSIDFLKNNSLNP